MEFNSLIFLLSFPLIVVLYYLLPGRGKTFWIFAASCIFYMCWNYKYIFLLLSATIVTYLAGIGMDKCRSQRQKKCILMACILFSVWILFLFKYFNMFMDTAVALGGLAGISIKKAGLDLLLPVGISFYIFQTLGYVIDVYRGDVEAEKNFVNYGAFITFFPQLVAGPIERSGNLLKQMKEEHHLNPRECVEGFSRMLWGYFQKVVIADRIAVIVTAVYDDYMSYSGVYIVAATVLFAFQIYCDFDGYTNIAIGAAKILGFDLMTNFNAPYFARSVADFWHRWHISLSSWFRDYLYIPLGGNRRGQRKKYRNLMITFLVSGLWHGANWTYVIWGGLHGAYQVMENMWKNRFHDKRLSEKGKGNEKAAAFLQWIGTFLAVDFAWLFFRAASVKDAFSMIGRIFGEFRIGDILNREMAVSLGLEMGNIIVLSIALCILFLSDFLKDKGRIYKKIWQLPVALRWIVLYIAMFGILIFGYYGPEYNASQFIYFQF